MPTLSVIVNRVAYPPPTATTDGGESWYILLTSHGTCKGRMAWRPSESEALVLDGEWAVYKGEREFSFKQARLDVPTDPRDQLHYVCTRTKGLGPAAEELIWSHAGPAWQGITENAVPRLSGRVYAEFRLQIESLASKSEESRVVAALMGKGATMTMACKAWAMWEAETLGVINADPYRLSELEGYSFRDVDREIRRAYGIGDDDRRRIRAAVIYALRRLTDPGDTVAQWEALYAQAIGMLGGYADLISECTAELFADGTLKAFPQSKGVSLASDWNAETAIWEWVEKKGGARK